MPRRSKLTPEVQARICQAVGVGATYQLAAEYGGVTYDTLNLWRKTKPQFSEALKEAESRGVVALLAKIQQAASAGAWQAAAWILERRYPTDYGRIVQQVEHSGTVVQEHTGALEVHAVDYRDAIRALAPPPDEPEEAAG